MNPAVKSFIHAVHRMRVAQNRYYREGRHAEDLAHAKALEREVDCLLPGVLALAQGAAQPGLFDAPAPEGGTA